MDDFPFLSICGVERNYVRCDDLPVVFTKVIQKRNAKTDVEEDWFSYAHADDLLMVISRNLVVDNKFTILIVLLILYYHQICHRYHLSHKGCL